MSDREEVRAREERDLESARESELWGPAVSFLREEIPDSTLEKIRRKIEDDPAYWWAVHHMGFGLQVRNALREAGFGEEKFGVSNLDNVYVALVEEAAGGDR